MKKYNVLVTFYYGSAWVEVEAQSEEDAEQEALEELIKAVNEYGKANQIEEL